MDYNKDNIKLGEYFLVTNKIIKNPEIIKIRQLKEHYFVFETIANKREVAYPVVDIMEYSKMSIGIQKSSILKIEEKDIETIKNEWLVERIL